MESNIHETKTHEQYQDYQISDIWHTWDKPKEKAHLRIGSQESNLLQQNHTEPRLTTEQGGSDSLIASSLNLRIRAPEPNAGEKRLKMGEFKA